MFKKINLCIILVVLAGFGQSVQAVIIRGAIWSKPCEDGTDQKLYCLSDYHCCRMKDVVEEMLSSAFQCGYLSGFFSKYRFGTMLDGLDTVEQEQKKQMYIALDFFGKDDVIVLVEDLDFAIRKHGIIIPEQLKVKDFLNNITQECIDKNLPVINLECRQHYSMNKFYSDYSQLTDQQLKQLGLNRSILDGWRCSASDAMKNFNTSVQEISLYMNGPFLKLYSNKEVTKLLALKRSFLDDCIANNYCDPDQQAFVDAPILDIKAINYIHGLSDKKHIVFAMGGRHIENIECLLPALGYKKIREYGCPLAQSERFFDRALDISNRLQILKDTIDHGRTFRMKDFFIGSTQSRCMADEQSSVIKSNAIVALDPDKLLISTIHKYPTRFPFCLLLSKVASYLKIEHDFRQHMWQKQEQDRLFVAMVFNYPMRFPFCLFLPQAIKLSQQIRAT